MGDQWVLAYDLGGTKLLCGVVNAQGQVIDHCQEFVAREQGKEAVLDQMANIGRRFLARYKPIKRGGIASAGPLDPRHGLLLDPTNLVTHGHGWGQVEIVRELETRLGLKFYLQNDAAATALAERWVGDARNCDNFMVMTLGTGVGIGVFVNGQLLKAGRGLHPEASHIPINALDETAPCGCGKFGCVEAYLSGANFARRMAKRWGLAHLSGKELKQWARQGDDRARQAFAEYADYFALAVDAYVCLFAPEKILLTGGFSDSSEMFLERVHSRLSRSLARRRVGIDLYPEIRLSSNQFLMGLIGGAYIAFQGR